MGNRKIMNTTKITYCDAINKALYEEMEANSNFFIHGIGVGDFKDIFGSTKGLLKRFGKDRVMDTPLSEDSITGFAIGAAMNGMPNCQIHIRADFALLAVNQLINMAATIEYISNGLLKCPLVVRIIIGRGWGQGCQHSKALFSLFAKIPGLKVVAPATVSDAYCMTKKAIKENKPVIIFEHRWLYWQEGYIGDKICFCHNLLKEANPSTYSRDKILLVSFSWGVVESIQAAKIIEEEHNVGVGVLDLRVLSNLNMEYITQVMQDYTDCIVVENDWGYCGIGGEIIAKLKEADQTTSKHFRRLGFKNIQCPTARHLENDFYFNAEVIIREAEDLLVLKKADLSKYEFYSHTNKFKGPF